jgi:methyltransferase family protein
MDGPVESRARLLALVRGYRISQAIYVAARLGIPDLLADGPREIDELAHATGSHPPSLRRVLLFLAGVGVLDKVGPSRFALTEVAALLRTGVSGSLRPSVLLWLDESHWRPWGHLLHTVRTGETAFGSPGGAPGSLLRPGDARHRGGAGAHDGRACDPPGARRSPARPDHRAGAR